MKRKLKKGTYQHFKGNYYAVIGIARESESLEEFVLFKALFTSKKFGSESLWIKPVKMFFETIEVDGKKIPCFRYIGPTIFEQK